MANPLLQTIEALSKEKNVDPEVIITALQDAIEDRKSTRLNSSH